MGPVETKFFISKDNTWGFPAFFVHASLDGVYERETLWEGSEGHLAFVKLCKFIMRVMQNEVIDASFPLMLDHLDKVTLCRVRSSHAFRLVSHVDVLEV